MSTKGLVDMVSFVVDVRNQKQLGTQKKACKVMDDVSLSWTNLDLVLRELK